MDDAGNGPGVIVYTRPGCPFSMKLRTKLRLAGVAFESVDIWVDDEARALVRQVNDGNETVPTVRIGETFLTNPSLREVRALL